MRVGGAAKTEAGSASSDTLLQTNVKFDGNMTDQLKKIAEGMYGPEKVNEKTSGIKDLIFGLDNKDDAKSATSGLYMLINRASSDGAQKEGAKKQLAEILDLATSSKGPVATQDQDQAVAKLVELGKPAPKAPKPAASPRLPRPPVAPSV
jgi:hypothetical protein